MLSSFYPFYTNSTTNLNHVSHFSRTPSKEDMSPIRYLAQLNRIRSLTKCVLMFKLSLSPPLFPPICILQDNQKQQQKIFSLFKKCKENFADLQLQSSPNTLSDPFIYAKNNTKKWNLILILPSDLPSTLSRCVCKRFLKFARFSRIAKKKRRQKKSISHCHPQSISLRFCQIFGCLFCSYSHFSLSHPPSPPPPPPSPHVSVCFSSVHLHFSPFLWIVVFVCRRSLIHFLCVMWMISNHAMCHGCLPWDMQKKTEENHLKKPPQKTLKNIFKSLKNVTLEYFFTLCSFVFFLFFCAHLNEKQEKWFEIFTNLISFSFIRNFVFPFSPCIVKCMSI